MTQRELKFRVWDNGRKEWVHGPGNEVNLFGETIVFGEILRRPDDTSVSLDELNDLVALQYSGLKDKHGKEIYEGDIRKEMFDGLFVGDPQREHYFVMVYIKEWTMFAWLSITSGEYHKYLTEGASALDTEMYWTYPAGQDEPNNVELVGNLYTTPELVDPKMIEHGNS